MSSPLDTQTDPNFISRVITATEPAVVRIQPLPDQEGKPERRGTGSGFLFHSDGQILTNAHVVEGHEQVQVTLQDGRVFTGRVQGSDPLTDVAVVQIEGQDLPTIRLGDSDQLQAGDWAIAIGNPLGLDSSATAGIISGIGRTASDIGALEARVAFLQTDAAINPGNSGGPLLNATGEAIGVNSAIIRGAQSVGFAIPINQARRIADQLIQTGEVQHAFLGVRMRTVTPELLSQDNLEVEQGALIVEVLPDTPAEQAGLQPGDVITRVGDLAIRTVDQVQQQIEAAGVGQVLTLTIRRQAQELALEVTTTTLPSQLAS